MKEPTFINAVPKIREARLKVGKTQEQLAEELGVSRQTVSNLEHGRTFPNLAFLFLIATILGVAWSTLYLEGGKNSEYKPTKH